MKLSGTSTTPMESRMNKARSFLWKWTKIPRHPPSWWRTLGLGWYSFSEQKTESSSYSAVFVYFYVVLSHIFTADFFCIHSICSNSEEGYSLIHDIIRSTYNWILNTNTTRTCTYHICMYTVTHDGHACQHVLVSCMCLMVYSAC